jgi:hypothetical protein
MTLIERAALTHLLKVFDVDANVNDDCRFLTALVVVDRELNLLDNASRGDSLGVIAPIIPHRDGAIDQGASKARGSSSNTPSWLPRRSARFSCNHDS